MGNRINLLLKRSDLDVIKTFIVNNTDNNVQIIGNIKVKNYMEFTDSEDAEEVRLKLIENGVQAGRIMVRNNFEKVALMEMVWESFDSDEYWQKRYFNGGKFWFRLLSSSGFI